MFKKALIPLLVATALSGCFEGTPTAVDGSSKVSFTESLGQLTSSLPAEQREAFAGDVLLLQKNLDNVVVDLNGKNAAEISELAVDVRKNLTLAKEQAAAKVREDAVLMAKAAKTTDIHQQLKVLTEKLDAENLRRAFSIDTGVYGKVKNEVTGESDPVISVSLANNSKTVAFGASLDGVLSAPGGDVIHSGLLEVEIPEGLVPGAVKALEIKPSLISDWRSLNAPEGSTLSLSMHDIKGQGGESLTKELSFTDEDGKRYNELMEQLVALNPEALVNTAPGVVAPEVSDEKAAAAPEATAEVQSNDANTQPTAETGSTVAAQEEGSAATIEDVEKLEAEVNGVESTEQQKSAPEPVKSTDVILPPAQPVVEVTVPAAATAHPAK